MKYIKLFNTDSEYQEFVQSSHTTPYVAYVKSVGDGVIHYSSNDIK